MDPGADSTPLAAADGSSVDNDSWRDSPAWPTVDVVMPVRNEAETLRDSVGSILQQEYPGEIRIVLAVAPSHDRTEALAAELAGDAISIVPNQDGTTPTGLNRAIRAGSAPVVVRVDAHSELAPGYVRRAVEVLRRTGAGNVGGRQVPTPFSSFEAAVAAATSSWLGSGGAAYRTGTTAGPVDTVYLGVFDRRAIEEVGLYDERLIRNQDYELNIRLREAGHVIWFDPDIRADYRPRGSIRALARQYFEYGLWKAEVLRQHPASIRLRQFLPPAAVAASAAGLVMARRRPVAALVPLGYLGAVVAGALRAPGTESRARVATVAVVIHWTWSAGLLCGLVVSLRSLR